MDKRVIFAVAGSGKTTRIVAGLDLERRFLLVTYTENNISNLRTKIIARFGYFPANITLQSYFSFLHGFCYKPFLFMQMKTVGINFDQPPWWTARLNRNDDAHYVDGGGRLYHCRIAKLLGMRRVVSDVVSRLEKYFDVICFDEVQDFGGYDFDFLMEISHCKAEILMVGDFYQHTFVTSYDGVKNTGLHDDYETYKKRFVSVGLVVDIESLSKSYRCSQSVCDFIRVNLGIEIYSHSERQSDVIVFSKQDDADRIHASPEVVKLFYQDHVKYGCASQNWGGSKGIDNFQDVCVVLNATTLKAFEKKTLREMSPLTRNKLYVACSRPNRNLYIVSDHLFKKFK